MKYFIKTAVLLGVLTLLLLLIGQGVGGREGLFITGVLSLFMSAGAYWFSDRLTLKMTRAVEIKRADASEVYELTSGLAKQAGMPVPKIYWIPSLSPNAFATGRSPKHAAIVLTQGLLETLNHEELKGVIAHELGHIASRDTLTATVVATLAGMVSSLAMMLRYSLAGERSRSANPILWLLFALLMPVAAVMVKLAVSRSREYAADDWGAQLCGNPLYLAGALQKISLRARKNPMVDMNPGAAHLFIVNPLAGANFSMLFSTHPPIEKRIARLEAMARGSSNARI